MNVVFHLGSHPIVNHLVHNGDGVPDPSRWTWEPSVVIGIALFVGAYLYATRMLARRVNSGIVLSPWQASLFLLGCLVLFLSLVSPLDVLSDDFLFSAHMVQHMLLSVVVPVLLLLGTPGWLLRPLARPPVVRAARSMAFPTCAFLIFNVNFWLWHLPALYDLAVAHESVHILQHLTFIATGVLNWWPVLSPLRELPRLKYPLQLLYLFANCQPNVILGAILFFSRDVVYRSYLDAPRLFDISPHADQQLGALIMWVPGNAIYLVVFSVVFLKWFYGSVPHTSLPSR